MSKLKTLLLLSCSIVLLFATVPEFLQMPEKYQVKEVPELPELNPDFYARWNKQLEYTPEPPPSPLAVNWVARKAAPAALYRTAGVCDTSGHFYIVGGQTGTNVVVNTVYKYFADGDSWRTMANMPSSLSNIGCAFNANTNRIYVFGGYTGSAGVNTCYYYQIEGDSWVTTNPLFLAMLGTYAASIGDSIFYTGSDLSANSMGLWGINVQTNAHFYIATLPGGSASGMAASDGVDNVYFVGGWPSRDTVARYTKSTNTVAYFCQMPIGLHGLGADVVNNKLYMYNGGQSWNGGTNGVYSYDLSQGPGGTWFTENTTISLRFAGTYGAMFYPDTWRLHSTNGSLGYPNCDTLHERGTITPPPPRDAQLLRINAPSSSSPPNSSVTPSVTIKNAGTDTISNIPVTLWVDSAGVRIYNQSTTVTGPLVGGDTANVTFSPNFNVGPYGSAYVVTGFTALTGDLNPTNDTLRILAYLPGLIWNVMPPHPATSYRTGGCGDTMGHFYVFGGYTTTYSTQHTVYNVNTGAWTTLSPMLLGVMNVTGAWDPARNRIYVPGGYSPYRNQLQIYDVANDSWYYGANMPITSSGSPCVVVGDTLWVIGSSPTAGTLLGYNINSNSWFFGTARPNCQSYSMLTAYNRKLYSVGGWTNDVTVYEYDIATATWTALPNLPVGRHSAGLQVINDKIVCFGGGQSWSPPLNSVYVLDPTYPQAGWAQENTMIYGRIGAAEGAVRTGGRTRLHAACGYTGSANVNEHEAGSFPVPNDVGVASILTPAGIIAPDTLTPMAIVRNFGTQAATFDVWMSISPAGYADTVTGINLSAGAVDTVSFTDWLPGTGFAAVRCSTMMATDMDPSNDSRSDVAVVADYIENFEGQDGNFTSNTTSGWQHGALTGGPGGTPKGSEAWATNRTGAYSNSANWTLTSPTYYALQNNPVLAYWHWYENESYYDGYNVKMSTNGGTSWTIIHAWSGYGQPYDQVVYSGNSGIPSESAYSALDRTWKLNYLEVPVSNGDEFLLRWHFGTDASVTYWGTAIDYVCGLGFDTTQPFIRDVAVLTINEPASVVFDTAATNDISATARNNGEIAETFDLVFDITGPGAFAYSDTQAVSLTVGQQLQVSFTPSVFPDTGTYNAMCYVGPSVPSDTNMLNDTAYLSFRVQVGDPDAPWEAMADVPAAPSGKNPKSGSCLKGLNATGLLYFLKASNKPDFYSYDPATNTWLALETIPKGEKGADYSDGKYPKRGAAMEAYEPNKALYVVRGNNRLGFWKYQADTIGMGGDTIGWSKLATIPAGAKRCKYGTGLTLVEKGGEDHLFLMKGAKTMEFYLYSIAGDSWMQVTSPPVGASGKTGYKKGSIQAYDGSEFVYVLQGYYGSFFKYHVEMDSWTQLSQYNYKLMRNRDGKKKKFKDGASMVYYNDVAYCLKGGNTVEVWKYTVAADSWTQMPENWDVLLGPTGRKKVKDGGGMTMFGNFFWATKGKNTPEFYRHFLPVEPTVAYSFIPTNEGTMGRKVNLGDFKLTIAPNPAVNVAAVRYSIPVAGPVTFKVYNVTGALVKSHTIANPTKEGVFLVDKLPAGVYILRFNTGDIRVSRKLVLEK